MKKALKQHIIMFLFFLKGINLCYRKKNIYIYCIGMLQHHSCINGSDGLGLGREYKQKESINQFMRTEISHRAYIWASFPYNCFDRLLQFLGAGIISCFVYIQYIYIWKKIISCKNVIGCGKVFTPSLGPFNSAVLLLKTIVLW